MELFNYKDNCRLCLKVHTNFMKNIFTHCLEGRQDTLVHNIFSFLRVELDSHKDYPQFICRKCLTELENILLFKEDIQGTQDFLLGLFTAAYPNYGKDLHHSSDSEVFLKSVAVNTDAAIDLKNLGDSEYVRVPVNFLKQFSPQVHLERADVGIVSNELCKEKIETATGNYLTVEQERSVNTCKYCNEEFRSQSLVDAHCNKIHKYEEGKKRDTRKRISNATQNPLAKKVKTSENKNVSLDSSKLSRGQLSLPEMDLEGNNNTGLKAEVHDGSSNQHADTLSTGPSLEENQALFLQNFNLIAKKEAELIQTKQKSTQKASVKKHIMVLKKRNKTVLKPLKTNYLKSKIVAKSISVDLTKPQRSKMVDQNNILCRSVQFLKRYGWRKLNSSSRMGTTLSDDLFQNISSPTKANTKKVSLQKNSKDKSVLKEKSQKVTNSELKTLVKEDCDRTRNSDSSKQTLEVNISHVKVKRSDSMNSSRSRSLEKMANSSAHQSSANSISKGKKMKDSPTTSVVSNKCNLKIVSGKIVENTSETEEELPAPPMEKAYKAQEDPITCSKSLYDKTVNLQGKNPSSSYQNVYLKQETDNKQHEQLGDNRNEMNRSEIDFDEVSRKVKLLKSDNMKCSPPTDTLQIKKELRIRVTRDKSTEGNNNLRRPSLDFKSKKQDPQDSPMTYLSTGKLPRLRDRQKKTSSTSCSKTFSLTPSTNGRSIKKRGSKQLLDNGSSSLPEQEIVNSSIPLIINNEILQLKDESNEALPSGEDVKAVPKKRDCPRLLVAGNCKLLEKEIVNSSIPVVTNKILELKHKSDETLLSDKETNAEPKNPGRPKCLDGGSCNLLGQEIVKSSIPTMTDILKFKHETVETLVSHEEIKALPRKPVRPRKSPVATTSELNNFPVKNIVSTSKTPLLEVTQSELGYIAPSDSHAIKHKDMSPFHTLADRYEKYDNIGLRIRLRRAACESLSSLKYDTQELDENFPVKHELIDVDTNVNLNNVPDNKILTTSHDRKIEDNAVDNISLRQTELITEKVVALDVEDQEIQLVFVGDTENVDFDNEYVTFKTRGPNLESKNLIDQSKASLLTEKSNSISSSVDASDDDNKPNQYIIRSQSCLPLSRHKLKEFDNNTSKKDYSVLLNNTRPRSVMDLEMTPVERKGRPPVKFSAKQSKNDTTLNSRNVELDQEKYKGRSRSTGKSQETVSKKHLFSEIRQRSRPLKKDAVKISVAVRRNSSSNKLLKTSPQEHVDNSNIRLGSKSSVSKI